MSIKSLSHKVDRLARLARGKKQEGEFVLYSWEDEPPEGTKIDYVIDLVGILEDDRGDAHHE